MIMVIGPHKKKAEAKAERAAAKAQRTDEPGDDAPVSSAANDSAES